MYTQADVDAMIQKWINSPAGKARLKELGVGIYTPEEMVQIGEKLKADLIGAFLHIQTSGLGFFDTGAVQVSSDGERKVRISFSPAALKRKSLMYVPKLGESWDSRKTYYSYKNGKRSEKKLSKSNTGYTGPGIKDVFALFTQGWHAHGYVYGSWEDAYQTGMHSWNENTHFSTRKYGGTIRSRKDYPGNPFVANVVNQYINAYPGLEIKYPSAWGG